MTTLDSRVAVITGGASGIGAASARRFIEAGAYVVIADIEDARGQALAEELGPRARYVHADVGREDDIKAAIDAALQTFGRLDCMFSNAGTAGAAAPIDQYPTAAFEQTLDVLLRGTFLCIKHAAAVMKPQGSGSIISTASTAGMRAGYGGYAYSVAKAGIIHLTRSVAMELGESGVRANCICPGPIVTPLIGKTLGLTDEQAEQCLPHLRAMFAGIQPIRRAGLPEDIAQAALWLASDESSFVTGHALVVDGGMSGGTMWSQTDQTFQQLSATLQSIIGQ